MIEGGIAQWREPRGPRTEVAAGAALTGGGGARTGGRERQGRKNDGVKSVAAEHARRDRSDALLRSKGAAPGGALAGGASARRSERRWPAEAAERTGGDDMNVVWEEHREREKRERGRRLWSVMGKYNG